MERTGIGNLKQERLDALNALRKQKQEFDNQIREKAKTVFNDFASDLFNRFPKLKSYSWRQYTPYFNDGDECVFGAQTNDPYIQYGDEEEREDFYFSTSKYNSATRSMEPYTPTEYETEKNEAFKAVVDFLSNFSEDDFKSMFGDHVEVIVTANGIETEDYDHE